MAKAAAKPQGKSKAAQTAKKAKEATSASKKGGKKKWAKAKTKEGGEKAVIFNDKIEKQMNKEVPGYKVITIAVVSDRLKVNASLARQVIARLEKEGKIKRVIKHNKQLIYTRAVALEETEAE